MELIIVVIQCVTELQSLYVAALAWWVVKLPRKLKGHRSYPHSSSCVHHCRGGHLSRTCCRGRDASCMYIHLRGICKGKKTPLITLLACTVCGDSLLVKNVFHVLKQKPHQSYIHQYLTVSHWLLLVQYFAPPPSISEPHCEAAGYNSNFYIVQCQLTEKNRLQLAPNWKYILDQLPLWWWQYTSVAIGWSCWGCNWCCSVASSEVGGM